MFQYGQLQFGNLTFFFPRMQVLTTFNFSAKSGGLDLQGPIFIQEPPHRLEFSNSSGGRLDCLAQGSPEPEVEWVSVDGSIIRSVSTF